METTTSFAPLAGRLAAKAAEIRPAHGAKVSWANFMALFWCAIFEMLILLCEALDARAAADARAAVAAPSPRDAHTGPVLATGPRPAAMPRARPVLRLVQADDASSTPLARDAALAGSAAPHFEGHLRVWPPPWPTLCWRPPRLVVFPEKRVLASWDSARQNHYLIVTKTLMA